MLIFTIPLVRFPYSTDGMPRTTSTLSTSSVEMERMSTPRLVVLRLFSVDDVVVDDCVDDKGVYCILASVDRGLPSTTNSVPREEIA